MNPYLSSGQPGFTPDPKNNDASVNYLRRLKAQTDEEAVTPIAPSTGDAPPHRERRRSSRFRCTGSAAVTPEGTETRMWGTVTDISLRGCYVEMSSTLPVQTRVDLVMDVSHLRIRAKGIVRISYPGLGMGILTTELAPDQREFLDELLVILAQSAPVPNPQLGQGRTAAEAIASVDPAPFLHELRRFFSGKTNLSREEFIRIADRCRRP